MENRVQRSSSSASLRAMRWAASGSAMVFEFGVWCGIGYLGDRRWGTSPWLLLLGTGVGLAAFAWRVLSLLREIDRSSSPAAPVSRDQSEST